MAPERQLVSWLAHHVAVGLLTSVADKQVAWQREVVHLNTFRSSYRYCCTNTALASHCCCFNCLLCWAPQVLELVLPHVRDVKTMLACTLISTEVKHHTQRAVKHNLPALIAACPYDRYTSNSKLRYHPYLWLRGIAGDAWRSYEAGCALLGKVLGDSPAEAAEFLVKTGRG